MRSDSRIRPEADAETFLVRCRPIRRAPRFATSDADWRRQMALRLQEKPAEPARRLFGTDGIRGVANVYPMTGELMLQLGRAVEYLLKSGPHRPRVVIRKEQPLTGAHQDTA